MGHHYVPQYYLRGFALPHAPTEVWQFDKASGAFSNRPIPIDNVAQSGSFYSDETERQLNELVEIPADRVLERLRLPVPKAITLSSEDREHLAVYIATMVKRVPAYRQYAKSLVPRALDSVCSELREQLQRAATSTTPDLLERRLREMDAVERKFLAQTPPDLRTRIDNPWPESYLTDLVLSMHWFFVAEPADNQFVITDNPSFFFSELGLGSQDSELTFPLSSDLALFAARGARAKGNKVVRDARLVRLANARMIGQATRFVYSRAQAWWIPTVASKPLYGRRLVPRG